jgi:bifunctional DNA-binding transcriptional regulator/antitoxin component of YhaV-PrlF toxin-antitoxin module
MSALASPSFITTCSEDEDGNILFEFPDEFLEALGWKEGTTIDISIVGDRIVLREAIPTPEPVVADETPAPARRKSPSKGRTAAKKASGKP